LLAVPIVGIQAELGEVDVDILAVGDRGLRRETVLPVSPSQRVAVIDLTFPERLSILEVVT
jgi:hypothetical protein